MADNSNMVVSVSFPGLEKKSAPVRSLVNFMMENSSLYFKKSVAGGDGIFTVTDVNYDGPYAYLDLSGDWDDITRDVCVYGVLHRADDYSSTVNYCKFLSGCISPAEVLNPDGGDGGPEAWTGYENLIVSEVIPNTVNYSEDDSTLTISLIDDSGEQATLMDFSGTLHVWGPDRWYGTGLNAPVDDDYTFDHGVCTIENVSDYDEEEDTFHVFSLNTESRLIGNIRSKYKLYRDVNYYYANGPAQYDLYIKYNDDSNDKFKPIAKPSKAHAVSDDIYVEFNEPGEIGNNYRVVLHSNGSTGANNRVNISVYNNDSLVGTSDPWQMWYIPESYTWREVELDDSEFSSILKFKHADDGTSSLFFIDVTNDLPIELQLSGGADNGGAYDLTTDGLFAECNTVLLKANSNISVLENWVEDLVECDISDVKVTIDPLINKKTNEDESVTLDDSASTNGIMSVALHYNKKPEYDIQLRTTSFVIQSAIYDQETEEEIISHNDVFYKIGVCPLDGTEKSMNDIVELMSHGGLYMYVDYYDNWANVAFDSPTHLPYIASASPSTRTEVLDINKTIYSDSEYPIFEAAPKHMILPIVTGDYSSGGKEGTTLSNERLVGFAYFKLCNTDGTPYTVEAMREDIMYRIPESEDDYYNINNIALAFKTSMLNGGFTQSPEISNVRLYSGIGKIDDNW